LHHVSGVTYIVRYRPHDYYRWRLYGPSATRKSRDSHSERTRSTALEMTRSPPLPLLRDAATGQIKEFLRGVVFPFFTKKKLETASQNSWSMIIWDIWHTHINPEVVQLCKRNWVKIVIIPPNHTKDLQVLDLVANSVFKKNYRRQFRNWVEAEISTLLDKGIPPEQAHIKIQKRSINAVLPQWAKTSWEEVSTDTIQKGWESVGVQKCWEEGFQTTAMQQKERLTPEPEAATEAPTHGLRSNTPSDASTQVLLDADYYEVSEDEVSDAAEAINPEELEIVVSSKPSSLYQQLKKLPQSRRRVTTQQDEGSVEESNESVVESDSEYEEPPQRKRKRGSEGQQNSKRRKRCD